jgi:hypothetical protein
MDFSSYSESQMSALKKIEEKKIDLSSTLRDSRINTVQKDESYKIPDRSLNSIKMLQVLNQDSVDLFHLLEKSVNYMAQITQDLEEILEIHKNEEHFKKPYQKIQYASKCLACKKRELVTMNQCGHSYCKKCAGNLMIENKDCQECNEKFSHAFKVITAQSTNNFYSSQMKILCFFCKKLDINVLTENTCNHLCMQCVSKCFHSNEDYCPACWSPLFKQRDYLEIEKECEGCNKKKKWLNDCFGQTKCHHLMCGDCLEESAEHKMCKICSRKFNSFDLLQVVEIVSQQCENCKQIFSRKYLKRAGKKFICQNCH